MFWQWFYAKVQEPEVVPSPIDPNIAIQAQLEQLYALAYTVVLVLLLVLFSMWLIYQFFKCMASTVLAIGIIILLMIGIAISLTTPSPMKNTLIILYNRHASVPMWVYDGVSTVATTWNKASSVINQTNQTSSFMMALFGMSLQGRAAP